MLNKEDVLELMLSKALPPHLAHIKSLKGLHTATLHPNPSFGAPDMEGSSSGGDSRGGNGIGGGGRSGGVAPSEVYGLARRLHGLGNEQVSKEARSEG